ncbi:Dyp-type peroxidase [Phytohabitans kaempferiae]|uniref:Dyp-type peroxidase n=1 Tax=Phytohabitans kaempferiae TaxID=1620943 RepID=A0ABV6LUU9_9ACTN
MADDKRVPRRAVLAGAAAVAAGGAGVLAASLTARDTPATGLVAHQPGIVTPPPDRAVLAAYDVRATDRAGLVALFRRLTDAARGSAAEVMVAVGGSLFDGRYGLVAARPRHLTRMPSFPGDVLDDASCHGDLLIQCCAAGAPQPLTDPDLAPRWRIDGFRAENTVTANGRPSTRNLFGFREGAGNPDPGDAAEMERLVWVRPGGEEPSWTAGGTYLVARLIRFATALWDADPVQRQEAIFGRRKSDGAPLGRDREDADFDYADDPAGRLVALDAHIRLANPRTPQTEGSRILRRAYSYRRALDAAGHPDEGLVFVCFQQDLERGFAAVQRRLAGQPLDRYILTIGGGYFFALPGAEPGGYLGRALLEP